MRFEEELLSGGQLWWRIAQADWADPLDPLFAADRGGRWNPPQSFPTLYLNEDRVTARRNLVAFIARMPYEPEDLRPDQAPVLVGATLPRRQTVADAHTAAGLASMGLPATYPRDSRGRPVPHERCQPIGEAVHAANLRGVHARSAQAADAQGRELAWFPATSRSRARAVERLAFDDWFWA